MNRTSNIDVGTLWFLRCCPSQVHHKRDAIPKEYMSKKRQQDGVAELTLIHPNVVQRDSRL